MPTAGQEKITLQGYISDMQTVYHIPDHWLWENSLQNRLNLDALSSRLAFCQHPGQEQGYYRQYHSQTSRIRRVGGRGQGWMDMTWATDGTLGDSAGYVLTSMVDRLWMQFTFGNLEIKAGRQRINWGQTFVWNPNDIFNSVIPISRWIILNARAAMPSGFHYYTGNASTIELAAKIDSARPRHSSALLQI